MDCKIFQNIVIKFVERDLSENELNDAQKHIEQCEECRKKYEFVSLSLGYIEKEKQTQVNQFIETRIIQKIQPKTKSKLVKILQPTLIAALFIISIFIGNLLANVIMQKNYSAGSQQITTKTDTISTYVVNDLSTEDYQFINNQ